jgi:hypothetical protein
VFADLSFEPVTVSDAQLRALRCSDPDCDSRNLHRVTFVAYNGSRRAFDYPGLVCGDCGSTVKPQPAMHPEEIDQEDR